MKYELNLYSFYDINGMVRHLEDMAKKGWILDSLKGGLWCYRKAEPQALHYTVSYYAKASAFEPEPSDGQLTFQEFCDRSGWRLAASSAKLMIFVNAQENPVPIFTDPHSELEAITQSCKWMVFPYWMLSVILPFQLITQFAYLRNNLLEFLSSNALMFTDLALVLLLISMGSELVRYYVWRKKARAAAEQDEIVPTSKGSHPQTLVFWALGIMAVGIFTSRDSGQIRFLALYLLGFALLFAIVNGVRVYMKKKKVNTERNRIITLTVDILLAIALTVVITLDAFHIVRRPQDLPAPALTLSAITGEKTDQTNRNVRSSHSFLISKTEGWEYPQEGRNLSYEILDVHVSPLHDRCLDLTIEDISALRHVTGMEEIDPAPWGAAAAWQFRTNDEADTWILLDYGSRIAGFVINWEPSPEEVSRIVEILNP